MAKMIFNGQQIGGVESVNNKTGVVTISAGDVSAVPTSSLGVASSGSVTGVATLDSSGKLTAAQMPAESGDFVGTDGTVSNLVAVAALPQNPDPTTAYIITG